MLSFKTFELKQASQGEYYDVLDNMYRGNSEDMLQAIKYFDSMFPPESKTIQKSDDDNFFIQYAQLDTNMFHGPGLYILGMASKTQKMTRDSVSDMYELMDVFKDMIYPGLNIFCSVNNNTEPLLKRLDNIIKEKGLTSDKEVLAQHNFSNEPEGRYKTYAISVNESLAGLSDDIGVAIKNMPKKKMKHTKKKMQKRKDFDSLKKYTKMMRLKSFNDFKNKDVVN